MRNYIAELANGICGTSTVGLSFVYAIKPFKLQTVPRH